MQKRSLHWNVFNKSYFRKSFFIYVFVVMSILIQLILSLDRSFASTIKVHSAAELETVVSKAQPQDVIIIVNGEYANWSCTLTGQGAVGKPIIIKAESRGKVRFTGSVTKTIFKITGSYLELSGISFYGCKISRSSGESSALVELEGSTNCRITSCTFQENEVMSQFMSIVVISGKGESNRVDHCLFAKNVNNMELKVVVAKETVPLHTLIDHNIFKDKARVTWPVFNGGECVQVGQDPVLLGTRSSFTIVRDNQFIECNGEPEVISNKSSDNSYINNYFKNCQGELVMRGGFDCVVDRNIIEGGNSGIRVNGSHHKITRNKISGVKTGIRLMYGMASGKSEIGFYIATTDCVIAENRISHVQTGILVGDNKNTDWSGKFDVKRYPSRTIQDVAPVNNEIRNNSFSDVENEIIRKDN